MTVAKCSAKWSYYLLMILLIALPLLILLLILLAPKVFFNFKTNKGNVVETDTADQNTIEVGSTIVSLAPGQSASVLSDLTTAKVRLSVWFWLLFIVLGAGILFFTFFLLLKPRNFFLCCCLPYLAGECDEEDTCAKTCKRKYPQRQDYYPPNCPTPAPTTTPAPRV